MAFLIAHPIPAKAPRLEDWEKWMMGFLVLLALTLKFGYINGLPFNSDEPQHFHVAWGWTKGMVQYRDYFDNHTPLFHLLMAPLIKHLGERADILFWMRLAMLPLLAISLGCIGWLGTQLYSRRVGLWATLLAATCPVLLITGSQFRADILWMTAWFLTLAVGLTGKFTRGRAFAFGLLLGATFGVSMKTSLLLIAFLSAFGFLWISLPSQERRVFLKGSGSKILLMFGGLGVVPFAIAAFFANRHALSALTYCVFRHNTLIETASSNSQREIHLPLFFILLLVAFWIGRAFFRNESSNREQNIRRTLVFLTPTLFLIYLVCFWPLITGQDYLPALPLFAIPLAAWLEKQKNSSVLLSLAVFLQIGGVAKLHPPFHHRHTNNQTLVHDVLKMTHSHDFVMDAKGETLFRPRPFYLCLENITQNGMRMGKIPDTIAEQMASTHTCVSLLHRLPPRTEHWVKQYYLPVTDQIWVAGCALPSVQPNTNGLPLTRSFEIGVEANYTVESTNGPVAGTMDGKPCTGSLHLNPGPHLFICNDPRSLDVVWSRAVQNGFKPLNLRP